jgi:hypothetical protein
MDEFFHRRYGEKFASVNDAESCEPTPPPPFFFSPRFVDSERGRTMKGYRRAPDPT